MLIEEQSKPLMPKCQLKREGMLDFPRDIEKYRIVMKKMFTITSDLGGYQPIPKGPVFNVQLNVGILFFDKWVDIGPVFCDTAEEAYDWIQKTVFPPEPKEQIIWSGKYSQTPPQRIS